MSRVLDTQVYLEALEDALHDAVTQRVRVEAVLRGVERERDELAAALARSAAPDEP